MHKSESRRIRLLAVASGGGHWIQLGRLAPAFADCEVAFVSTLDAGLQVAGHRFYTVPDASRWSKIAVVRMAIAMTWIVLRERPDVVISTGAAPGYMALRLGGLLGAKTIWIDSIANVDELSMSGRMAGRHADLWLTQWPHLAKPEGPHFAGSVL
jgi:UDP-N-acetylglucosamine:LPS N-acetylglucosamine transferase